MTFELVTMDGNGVINKNWTRLFLESEVYGLDFY